MEDNTDNCGSHEFMSRAESIFHKIVNFSESDNFTALLLFNFEEGHGYLSGLTGVG